MSAASASSCFCFFSFSSLLATQVTHSHLILSAHLQLSSSPPIYLAFWNLLLACGWLSFSLDRASTCAVCPADCPHGGGALLLIPVALTPARSCFKLTLLGCSRYAPIVYATRRYASMPGCLATLCCEATPKSIDR